ncbi:unnamed protein product [Ambrosiozyma monospora]|uniref:Unnamed protein product n=1 Tax=Ambrosiozyma monospora TaxID=43982 RepID=A0A9W6YRD8_AMBMO|nr:unnamed protein product [Ambrosiozyma monospora]
MTTDSPSQDLSIQECWVIFENWLRDNWQEGYQALNPPITSDQLQLLERSLDVNLPEDYKESLRIHNGSSGNVGLIDGQEYLHHEEIIKQWKIWDDLLHEGMFDDSADEDCDEDYDSQIQPNCWWCSKWVPFTHDGSGDHFCLDLEPSSSGQSGQVITMWHDSPSRTVLATSFREYFGRYVIGVISGKFSYSEDYGGIINKSDLENDD